MPKAIDITGIRFGRLVAVRRIAKTKLGSWIWFCKCDCGIKTKVAIGHLRKQRNGTRSCGCKGLEELIKRSTKHGKSGKNAIAGSAYLSWKSMFRRCTTPTDPAYDRYGGRGINICKRWYKFENFLSDMGERPSGMSIDRINNNKGYAPGNCRWATRKEQANNKCKHQRSGAGKIT